ncbi:MAG TPA: MBL fold metallo-hydrolase, partial [Gemmatimonadaceae bacterium]|nr:MBL fold metallo-hydrolase [Gemmatimonadaceae bacterium]
MTTSLGRTTGLRTARIQASPQFNGRAFANTYPVSSGLKPGVERPSLREFLCGGERRVPSGPLPLVNPLPTWGAPPATGLRVTRLGHSTLLVEIDGVRILTDPVWSQRASPLAFAGPKRFHPAPVSLAALPAIDVVVLSHDHYDHLDRHTVRALARSRLPFVTSLGVGAHLEAWGIPPERITELDWWERTEVRGVTITAAPAQHFSGRGMFDGNKTLWASWVIVDEAPEGALRVFFSGDTGYFDGFREIGRRFGPFDVTLLETGAYDSQWPYVHMQPEQTVQAHQDLGGRWLLPIHNGTFDLAMHGWT